MTDADSLFTLQLTMQRLRFSQRRRLWREIQERASRQPGVAGIDVPAGHLVAWPDVWLYVTPAIITAAIEAVEGEDSQP